MDENKPLSSPGSRVLYFFPILHSRADLGGLEERVAARAIERVGRKQWEERCQSIEQGWGRVEEVIDSLELEYDRCRIYQDGLPVSGHELKIVTDLAQSGSRNYQLLLTLCDRGATLMGTESLELLLEEYLLLRNYLTKGEQANREALELRGTELLSQRDAYIAKRIKSTLNVGESGLLFLGMLHSVDDLLMSDIDVISPIASPLHWERPAAR